MWNQTWSCDLCPINVNVNLLYFRMLLNYLSFYFKQFVISFMCSSVCIVRAPLDFLHILCYLFLWFGLSKVTCKQSATELHKPCFSWTLPENKHHFIYIYITIIIYLRINNFIFYYFVVQQNVQKVGWCANVCKWVWEIFR